MKPNKNHPSQIHPSRMQYQSDADARKEIERVANWSILFGILFIAGAIWHNWG